MATPIVDDVDDQHVSTPVIAAEGLVLERGGQRVLDDLGLSVAPEQTLLIRGKSGAGKTSLFEVLGLLARPDAGTLSIAGTDATAASERERARLRRTALGFVFQDFQLVPDLTARENAILPQTHTGDRDEDWVDELFEILAIGALAERYPHALSGGEKQRVAIARALANRPSVVLADEPTGQLDPDATEQVRDLLVRVQDRSDAALVVVSHDRQLGDRFDEVLYMEEGALVDGDDVE